jgi:hypothetical protein
MKYNWNKMTEEQKIKACQQEIDLETHNGTTKDDLINILRWLWDKFEIVEDEQTCRVCGCTWDNACEGGCYWVEDDLCSKCANERVSEDGSSKDE